MAQPAEATVRDETLVFTCAGAAYSGQVANRAGLRLAEEGVGNLFCVAAVAAGVSDKLERARHAKRRIAIDGCDDHCCRRVLEGAGLSVDAHRVVTDLGVEKQPTEAHMLVDSRHVANDMIQCLPHESVREQAPRTKERRR